MVPEGWKPTKLGDISSLVTSGSRDWAKFYSDSGSKFIRMTNLRRDGIHLKMDDLKFVNIESGSADGKRTSLQAGDILISITAELGKIGWVPPGLGEAYINQHTALVRVEPTESESKFVAYLLSSKPYHRRINALNDAGAKAGLNLATIRSLPIALPDIPEQKKIAQILSTWDQAITATERLLENSQQRKKGLMQQLLTGKKRLPGFEGEWHQYALTDVAKVIVSPVDKKSHPEEKPVQLCNYTDVYYNTRITKDMPFMEATAKDSEIEKYTLQAGDVVITKDSETPGDIAVPALVAEDLGGVICGYHLAILRARPSKLNGAFLNCLLSMPRTRYYFFSLATGATRFGLSVGAIHNAEVTLPPVPEQEAIANILTTCDDELEIISERLDRLKQEKKALMQQLLTGKRRVKVEADAA